MDIFLEYDWLVKYNPEVNWDTGTVQFTKSPKTYQTKYQDITFVLKTRRLQPMNNKDKEQ